MVPSGASEAPKCARVSPQCTLGCNRAPAPLRVQCVGHTHLETHSARQFGAWRPPSRLHEAPKGTLKLVSPTWNHLLSSAVPARHAHDESGDRPKARKTSSDKGCEPSGLTPHQWMPVRATRSKRPLLTFQIETMTYYLWHRFEKNIETGPTLKRRR